MSYASGVTHDGYGRAAFGGRIGSAFHVWALEMHFIRQGLPRGRGKGRIGVCFFPFIRNEMVNRAKGEGLCRERYAWHRMSTRTYVSLEEQI